MFLPSRTGVTPGAVPAAGRAAGGAGGALRMEGLGAGGDTDFERGTEIGETGAGRMGAGGGANLIAGGDTVSVARMGVIGRRGAADAGRDGGRAGALDM